MADLPRLILMTRYPAPGRVKTRLIPELGEAGAALLQRRMTERALETAQRLAAGGPLEIEVCFAGADEGEMRQWLGREVRLRPQHPGDLGQRMWRAFAAAFDEGAPRAVMIGADCPDLNEHRLRQAFDRLKDRDLVLGPAADGGYYLIGLRRPIPELFQGVEWSTERVLAQTRAIADQLALRVAELEQLADVDRPEDLERLPGELLDGIVRG